MGEDMAGRRAAGGDATAGDRRSAGRAGPAAQRYEVRPVAWVESPLKQLAQAPNQGREGAPPAWLAVEPDLAEAARDLRAGQQVLVLTWLDRARRDELACVPGDDPASPPLGVFSTRSPDRPNPIGVHRAQILAVEGLAILAGSCRERRPAPPDDRSAERRRLSSFYARRPRVPSPFRSSRSACWLGRHLVVFGLP